MPATRTKVTVSAIDRRKTHYNSPKLVRRMRTDKAGFGVFATQSIDAGELLVVWGGDVVTGEELVELPATMQRHSIQVEDNLYMVSGKLPEVADFINHSCSPNAGLSGQMSLVALHSITKGEEVCYDYAMSDGSAYDEFQCSCGVIECRGRVTGRDWAIPELQIKYAGFFSPYLQRRISGTKTAALKVQVAESRELAVVPDIMAEAP